VQLSNNNLKKQNSFITIDKLFILQDGILISHLKNNDKATLFVKKCIELCLNWNQYCKKTKTLSYTRDGTFGALFQETISSLVVAYRIVLWGAISDGFAVLRTVMEGLGFINDIIDKGDFVDISIMIGRDKLKKGYIEKRYKNDKVLIKTIGKISDLAAHFTQTRIAERFFKIDDKIFTRIAMAYHGNKNELSKRLGYFLNTTMYAAMVLKEFLEKYYKGSLKKKFYKDYQVLEKMYSELAKLLKV
jgi:hypothetical protein